MTEESARKIVTWLKNNGIDATVFDKYSGRFMYGDETAGVVAARPSDVAFAMGSLGIKDTRRVDNMAMEYIVY